MARINFDSLFDVRPDRTLTPRQRIRVGGVELGPGVIFSPGAAFGGVDFTRYIGQDLEISTDGDVSVITGIYPVRV